MNPIRLVIQQPVTVTVGVILVVLAGLMAITRLPIALAPAVDDTIISVTTTWQGASPADVELSIVDKQEERLSSLGSLRLMTSTSAPGLGRIRLEFVTGVDKEAALREVTQKLGEVPEYPENVDEPVIEASDPENRDFIAWIVFGSSDPAFDVRVLRDFAVDRIEPFLERVPGVSEINVLGGREREVQVRVDPAALAQHGVTPGQFAAAMRETNRNFSGGELAYGKLDVKLRSIGEYDALDQIERTVIAQTAAGTVHVGDVADVVLTYKEATSFVRSKGEQVIAINADREPDSNIIEVMDGLRAAIAALNAPGGLLDTEGRRLGLNGGLHLTQVYDQTVYIDQAIDLVRTNIWLGGALAVIILFLFLRSVASVGILAFTIPLSVIGAIVVMVVFGRTINVISLAGMAFATGMVVDNAIVVLENIFRHLEMGKAPFRAAYDGTVEVWGAIVASTLTTIVVFIPILLVQEEAGQLFRDISLAICAAVALSLVVSITVVPCAAARLLRGERLRRDVARSTHGRGAASLGRLVERMCGSTPARLVVIIGLTGISVAGTIVLMPPADYLPKGNRNLVFGLIIPPPGYNIAQLEAMGLRVEETVRPFWEAGALPEEERAAAKKHLPQIPTVKWPTMEPGDPIVPPPLENYFVVAFEGIMFHGAVATDGTRATDMVPLLSHAARPSVLPGVIAFPFQVPLFRLGGSTGSAVKVQLAGGDLAQLVRVASGVYQAMAGEYGYGAIQPVPGNFAIPAPEIQVRPDLVRLSELGLTSTDVGIIVAAAGDGAIIGEYRDGGESIDLAVVTLGERDGGGAPAGALADLPVAAPGGRIVPLGSIARIDRTTSAQEIHRSGRRRSISFEVSAPPGVALETLIAGITTILDQARAAGTIPPTIETSLAGSASKLEEVRRALLGDGTFTGTITSALFLALVVVYLLLCVLFQGFVQPLIIMVSVPLATLGGFAALFGVFIWSTTDRHVPIQMLDVVTMLGFFVLIGTVVNNAILIVHQTRNFMAESAAADTPMTGRHAVAEAVRTRVRPILMTALTTVFGLLPLVVMPGAGSELYRGLGAVVLGGLLVSTIFTLVLVPALLSFTLERRRAPREAVVGAIARTPVSSGERAG
jgi:HAE1 family hydrophobic/amphiphilic exporter-1